MTDYPAHCIRVTSWPAATSVSFASNVFPPGIIGDTGVSVSLSSGRLIPASGAVGTSGEGGVLLGPLGPITATDFTVTLTQQLTNAGTWVGLAIQGPSDIGYKQTPGYMAIWRTNGTMDVYRYNSSGGPTSIGSVAGGSYVYGEDKSISIRITPTQVIATPVGSGQSVTINDTTYRPASWHVHACRNNGGANSILSASVS